MNAKIRSLISKFFYKIGLYPQKIETAPAFKDKLKHKHKKVKEYEVKKMTSFVSYAKDKEIIQQLTIPKELTNYHERSYFKIGYPIAKEKLKEKGIDIAKIDWKVADSQRIITHSDIRRENILRGRFLIDWDLFGFYPMGFDLAFLYFFKNVRNKKKLKNPIKWIHRYGRKGVKQQDWKTLLFNFTYFLLVFSCRYIPNNPELSAQIDEKLVKLLTNSK